MATHSSILAWRIPWTEEPGGLPSRGVTKESDTTERYIYHLGKEYRRQVREGRRVDEWERSQPSSGRKTRGINSEKPRGGSVVPKDGDRFLHRVSEGRLGD